MINMTNHSTRTPPLKLVKKHPRPRILIAIRFDGDFRFACGILDFSCYFQKSFSVKIPIYAKLTTTRQSQRIIRILDLKLDKLFSSFCISHLPVKTHWNWVCNSSLTAFTKAREQRDQRDRPSSWENYNKKSKKHNTINSHRFFVF